MSSSSSPIALSGRGSFFPRCSPLFGVVVASLCLSSVLYWSKHRLPSNPSFVTHHPTVSNIGSHHTPATNLASLESSFDQDEPDTKSFQPNSVELSANPETIIWPSDKVLVPAMGSFSKSKIKRFVGLHRPSWALEHNLSVFLYQNSDRSLPYFVPNSWAKEINFYLKFIIDHYESLPNVTIFVHGDSDRHNPMLLHWIDCLRDNVTLAFLSPNFISLKTDPGAFNSVGLKKVMPDPIKGWLTFLRIVNLPQLAQQPARSFYCCTHFAMSRATIRMQPLSIYQELYRCAEANVCNSWMLEAHWHVLFGYPLRISPIHPCVHFRCECEDCVRTKAGSFFVQNAKKKFLIDRWYMSVVGMKFKVWEQEFKTHCRALREQGMLCFHANVSRKVFC